MHVHRVWDLVVLRVRRSDDDLRYSTRLTLAAVIYGWGKGGRGGRAGGERAWSLPCGRQSCRCLRLGRSHQRRSRCLFHFCVHYNKVRNIALSKRYKQLYSYKYIKQIKCIYYTLFHRCRVVQQEKTRVFWEKVNLLQYCSIILFFN